MDRHSYLCDHTGLHKLYGFAITSGQCIEKYKSDEKHETNEKEELIVTIQEGYHAYYVNRKFVVNLHNVATKSYVAIYVTGFGGVAVPIRMGEKNPL